MSNSDVLILGELMTYLFNLVASCSKSNNGKIKESAEFWILNSYYILLLILEY